MKLLLYKAIINGFKLRNFYAENMDKVNFIIFDIFSIILCIV